MLKNSKKNTFRNPIMLEEGICPPSPKQNLNRRAWVNVVWRIIAGDEREIKLKKNFLFNITITSPKSFQFFFRSSVQIPEHEHARVKPQYSVQVFVQLFAEAVGTNQLNAWLRGWTFFLKTFTRRWVLLFMKIIMNRNNHNGYPKIIKMGIQNGIEVSGRCVGSN